MNLYFLWAEKMAQKITKKKEFGGDGIQKWDSEHKSN